MVVFLILLMIAIIVGTIYLVKALIAEQKEYEINKKRFIENEDEEAFLLLIEDDQDFFGGI